MSAFSFTAPFISAEEETQERLELTEEESRRLERDLYGIGIVDYNSNDDNENQNETETEEQQPNDANDANDVIDRALTLVNESMVLLPASDTKDYYKACEVVPEIVRTESNPVQFLKFVKYDPWAAALRLSMYWKLRIHIFGQDRGYLPMTIKGAMQDDISSLQKGIIQLLPITDRFGRSILFLDRIRAVKPALRREVAIRILFYFMQIISSRNTLLSRSYAMLINVKGYDLYTHFDRILVKQFSKCIQCIPISTVSIHLFSGSGQSVLNLILPILKQVLGKQYRLRMVLHSGSDNEILERLSKYGLNLEEIGPYIKTSYKGDLSKFLHWLKEQDTLEQTKQTLP